MQDKHTHSSYWALRIAFGVVPIVAGLDKFTNLLTNWAGYLSPLAARLLPVAPSTFMHIAGVVEIVVGIGILAGKARIFGFIAAVWLAAIALNLVTTGHYLDVAARDAVMAVAAYALGRLALAVEQPVRHSAVAPQRPAQAHA